MRIEVRDGSLQGKRIDAGMILKYLIGNDEELDTLIMCKSSEMGLVVTNRDLYYAVGSIKGYDKFKLNKLVKLLEVVKIMTIGSNPILKEGMVEELRKKALEKSS